MGDGGRGGSAEANFLKMPSMNLTTTLRVCGKHYFKRYVIYVYVLCPLYSSVFLFLSDYYRMNISSSCLPYTDLSSFSPLERCHPSVLPELSLSLPVYYLTRWDTKTESRSHQYVHLLPSLRLNLWSYCPNSPGPLCV